MKNVPGIALICLVTGCAHSVETPQPSHDSLPVLMRRAEQYNWRLRVHADTTREGRVSFARENSIRIAGRTVPTADIKLVERAYETGPGGKYEGGFVGAAFGVALGLFAVSIVEGLGGRECTVSCYAEIFIPTIGLFTILGAGIGTAIDPPARDWAPIWRR